MNYTFTSELWVWPGQAAWHFITLPKNISEEIKLITAGTTKGFGSVRVSVAVKEVTWQTSIFPDSKSGSFMLPVKKEIRKKLSLEPGAMVKLTIQIA